MTDLAVDPGGRHAAARRDPRAGAAGVLVGMALVAGLTLEIGLRGGVHNAVVAAGLAVAVATLLAGGRGRRREARVMALVALVPIAFLAVRASPWLAWSNLIAAAALLGPGVLYGRSGSVLDATPGRIAHRSAAALGRAVRGTAVVRLLLPRTIARDRTRVARVAKALAVTLPVLVVLVALLASADAVFASLLTPDMHLGPVAGHAVLAVVLALPVLGLAVAAPDEGDDRRRQGAFGTVEVATMLGLAAFVLGLFVVSQLVALTDAGHRLIESAGLTPAEYARSGFFQLCWAAGLVLAFLWLVRSLATPEALASRLVRGLGTAVPSLALGLVVVSLRRMALYDQAFGLTMLRLWVVGAAVWMGSVLVMTAMRNAGAPGGRNWLVAGAGASAVALVLVADVGNPEAFVARHNLAHADRGAELDLGYLAGLSDDAVPVLADALDGRGGALRCSAPERGVAALNLAVARADDLRDELCGA
jgi:Domain of unknown function (DUF4173)